MLPEVSQLSWVSDSKYALDVTLFRARVSANAAMAQLARLSWARLQPLTVIDARHVHSHAGDAANECADVLADLGCRGVF